jgi:hypothetical protein
MKRPRAPRTAPKHSLAAFALTVALAFVASVAQLLPDIAAQSADAMSTVPDALDFWMLDAAIK